MSDSVKLTVLDKNNNQILHLSLSNTDKIFINDKEINVNEVKEDNKINLPERHRRIVKIIKSDKNKHNLNDRMINKENVDNRECDKLINVIKSNVEKAKLLNQSNKEPQNINKIEKEKPKENINKIEKIDKSSPEFKYYFMSSDGDKKKVITNIPIEELEKKDNNKNFKFTNGDNDKKEYVIKPLFDNDDIKFKFAMNDANKDKTINDNKDDKEDVNKDKTTKDKEDDEYNKYVKCISNIMRDNLEKYYGIKSNRTEEERKKDRDFINEYINNIYDEEHNEEEEHNDDTYDDYYNVPFYFI